MSRVQLALNVTNVDAAVEFYRRLFGTEPAKRRPGYANFAIASPPLKLVLIENPNAPSGTLNHLGVEVESSAEVGREAARLRGEGFALRGEDGRHVLPRRPGQGLGRRSPGHLGVLHRPRGRSAAAESGGLLRGLIRISGGSDGSCPIPRGSRSGCSRSPPCPATSPGSRPG